jgi:hypothetical protein
LSLGHFHVYEQRTRKQFYFSFIHAQNKNVALHFRVFQNTFENARKRPRTKPSYLSSLSHEKEAAGVTEVEKSLFENPVMGRKKENATFVCNRNLCALVFRSKFKKPNPMSCAEN